MTPLSVSEFASTWEVQSGGVAEGAVEGGS